MNRPPALVGPKRDLLRAASGVEREHDELRRLLAGINVVVEGLGEAHGQVIDATERLDEKRWEAVDEANVIRQQLGRLMRQRDQALDERDEARRLLDFERAKSRRLLMTVARLQRSRVTGGGGKP